MADGSSEFRRVEDFRRTAELLLPGTAWQYYSNGHGDNQTLSDNCDSFKRYRVLPRVLRDVSSVDTSVTVLGSTLDFPVGISPTAHHKLAHPDGEIATVKAAASAHTGMVLSPFSNHCLEDVAAAAPQGTLWFSLVFFKDLERNKQLLQRAEQAGYRAVFLTVDQPRYEFLQRPQVSTEKSKPRTFHSCPNLMFPDSPPYDSAEYCSHLFAALKQPMTWDDVDWVKKNTILPVVLKGILSAEDAREAVRRGVDAILVSNHGGRQLDGVPATIDVLADIVCAVDGKAEVYLDGGVRTGTDVLKALALGARCVFIGRPALWGLACNGEKGLRQLLDILKEELVYTMARTGCARLADINPTLVVHESSFSLRNGEMK